MPYISQEECERVGGHCFADTGVRLMSYPPQTEQRCKHCDKRRLGTPREPMEWTYDD